MGRCVGKSSLILQPDNRVYDLEYHFPDHLKTVALSMSGGVESTLLLLLLIDFYGANNIRVFSGEYRGRRSWESVNSKATAKRLGVFNHHSILQHNEFMSPQDNLQMFKTAKAKYEFDSWFNGTNAKMFDKRAVTSQEMVNRLNNIGYYVPFAFLKKEHTVDLYHHIDREEELYSSFSCTLQPHIHCGRCPYCFERVRGFNRLGKKDQATYAREWEDIVKDCSH